ncbi:M81 family metallopeptidase [Anderseniella sp. Alg231-50]|uniref:M81 family metallopeptidase n=1 Tax=Anderseniella sp. Alg231-50 TaxID=1922226 RepID=UPI000D55E770
MTSNVLVAEIMHETNTFNRIATVKADFETRYWHEGMQAASALAGTNTEIAGFIEAAQDYGWSLQIPLAASASPSGPMAADDWNRVKHLILEPLKAGQKFDAVALVLHGSMVTESTLDAEGDLLGEVRALAGSDMLIAVTLDMHANVSPAMIAAADMMTAYRTYPHVDQRERALHMARLMEDVLRGAARPHLVMARMPMMDAANHGQTADGQPMPDLLKLAETVEGRDGIMCASIQIGFPWSDVPDIGPNVVVTASDDRAGRTAAGDLMQAVWQSRHDTQLEFATPEEAMALAKRGEAGDKPLVLADFADNPAGGAYGDSPNLLRAMIAEGLENAAFATISDPASVERAVTAGVGAIVQLSLGGMGAPDLTPPLEVEAKVVNLTDGEFVCAGPMWQGVAFSMGATAVVRIAGIDVIVSSVPTAVMDLNVFRSVGINPEELTTIGLKSRNHFKAAYGLIARETLLVDAGGIASMRLQELTFRNVPRPIWPLENLDLVKDLLTMKP